MPENLTNLTRSLLPAASKGKAERAESNEPMPEASFAVHILGEDTASIWMKIGSVSYWICQIPRTRATDRDFSGAQIAAMLAKAHNLPLERRDYYGGRG